MAPHSSTLDWKIPWTEEPGGLQSMGSRRVRYDWATSLSLFTFTFHFHALEKEMATHSSVLAWRIPGTGEPGGLPSIGSHRVGHDWSDLAAAAAVQCGLSNKSPTGMSEGDGRRKLGLWIWIMLEMIGKVLHSINEEQRTFSGINKALKKRKHYVYLTNVEWASFVEHNRFLGEQLWALRDAEEQTMEYHRYRYLSRKWHLGRIIWGYLSEGDWNMQRLRKPIPSSL